MIKGPRVPGTPRKKKKVAHDVTSNPVVRDYVRTAFGSGRRPKGHVAIAILMRESRNRRPLDCLLHMALGTPNQKRILRLPLKDGSLWRWAQLKGISSDDFTQTLMEGGLVTGTEEEIDE